MGDEDTVVSIQPLTQLLFSSVTSPGLSIHGSVISITINNLHSSVITAAWLVTGQEVTDLSG